MSTYRLKGSVAESGSLGKAIEVHLASFRGPFCRGVLQLEKVNVQQCGGCLKGYPKEAFRFAGCPILFLDTNPVSFDSSTLTLDECSVDRVNIEIHIYKTCLPLVPC